MPLLKKSYTSKDYWNLPDGQRAELIDGQFYNMAPPSRFIRKFPTRFPAFSGNYLSPTAENAAFIRLLSPSIWMQMIKIGSSLISLLSAIRIN